MGSESSALNPLENIVIVGGGTAGWMAAVALSKVLSTNTKITLVESDQIGTVGVGEATIPEIRKFNRMIGVDENEFLAATGGTFKLGIEFVDWKNLGSAYIHPFGKFGTEIDAVPFFQHLIKAWKLGHTGEMADYSLATLASYANKFVRPVNIPNSPLQEIAYAFHFDAHLYAKFLRKMAEKQGVVRIEGKITQVIQDASSGDISALQLESGQIINGDFFVDCSGFVALLMEKTLQVGYEDWSYYLPCNSAVTVGSSRLDPLPSYTRATAKTAGWQWRIPLQHRTGNGYVYCDRYISDEQAQAELLNSIQGEILGQPKKIKFTTGRRQKSWEKNCIALGLSSGFLEPLESTSIHLVHEALANFIALLPGKRVEPALRDKFNALMEASYTNIRDFLVLHYYVNERTDSAFWTDLRAIDVPARLREKLALFRESGRVFRDMNELFGDVSWFAVMHGQGLVANAYHPIVDTMDDRELLAELDNIRHVIASSCEQMPLHQDYVERTCKFGI